MVDYDKVKLKKSANPSINPNEGEITKRTAVAHGKVKKPSLFSRAGKLFFGADGFRGIADHLVHEVFIPSIQNTIADVTTAAIHRAIFGESYSHKRGRRAYDNYYIRGGTYRSSRLEASRGGIIDYDEEYGRHGALDVLKTISFDSYEEAHRVLMDMDDSIAQYKQVSVADYYELSGVASKFTDHQFGWVDLIGTKIIPGRDELWYIKLPRPKAI